MPLYPCSAGYHKLCHRTSYHLTSDTTFNSLDTLVQPGDLHGQDVSAGAAVLPAVKAEAPVATEFGSNNSTQEENVKAPLKPLKLEYERIALPVSNSEVQSKAAEDSIEPKESTMQRAVENPLSANTAEDRHKVKVPEGSTTLNSSQNLKASQSSRSVNFGPYTPPTITTAEMKSTPEIPVPEKVSYPL